MAIYLSHIDFLGFQYLFSFLSVFPVIDLLYGIIVGGQFIAFGVSSLSPQSVAVLLKLVPLPSTGSKSSIFPRKKSSFENLGLTNEGGPISSDIGSSVNEATRKKKLIALIPEQQLY